MTLDERIITISDAALSRILDVRSQEPDASGLALCLEVSGRRGPGYGYELGFVPVADAAETDVLDRYGDLPVVIPAASVDSLRGAALHFDGHGLSIENPNRPPPEPWWPGDDAPLAERVAAVLEHEINPAIAGHGGWAELAEVEGDTVHLSLGGGCQGCGMAQVTLRQGIENPNRPPPEPWWPGDDAPLAERVAAVLEHEINPAIAGHGGWAELAEVEGDTVYLNLGGGCQGCGMAQVTLRQGIEVGLRNWIPEIGSVVDVTDHGSGEHPYY